MKKILIFSLAYYPKPIGGAEIAIKEITDRLPDIEWHMVTLRFDRRYPRVEKVGNVLVHRIGFGSSKLHKLYFQFAAALEARRLHKIHSYDAVWAVMAHSSGVPAALFKTLRPHMPYVLTLQEGDPPEHIERVMRPLWPLFVRAFTKADKVQAISTYLGAWARKRGFRGQVEIVPNGVDVEHFSGEPVPHGGTVLITTSRLVKKNGVDTIIKALPHLERSVSLNILGTGPDEESLKRLAASLEVTDRVAFLGYINHHDMPEHLHQADIFVRPSRSEGMGSSFIEAFAAELPVIATQVGGISDFLFDAKRNPDKPTTGWAVDVESPTQIADAVRDILGNPQKTTEIVARAKALAAERYDWDLVARNMREKIFD